MKVAIAVWFDTEFDISVEAFDDGPLEFLEGYAEGFNRASDGESYCFVSEVDESKIANQIHDFFMETMPEKYKNFIVGFLHDERPPHEGQIVSEQKIRRYLIEKQK